MTISDNFPVKHPRKKRLNNREKVAVSRPDGKEVEGRFKFCHQLLRNSGNFQVSTCIKITIYLKFYLSYKLDKTSNQIIYKMDR
jgi:hypothetical protein